MTPGESLERLGFAVFPVAEETRRWAEAARTAAAPIVEDPEVEAVWLRCEGTWFAGVDVLPNAEDGAIAGVPLAGPALDLLAATELLPNRWHSAQVSVTYPGYPRPREGESPGAARYRMQRDAAHVDGLLPVGPDRRRFLQEPHAFILGLPLTPAHPEAAPLVLWPGAHKVMGKALRTARDSSPSVAADKVDLTDAYRRARCDAFDQFSRTPVPLAFGQAVLLHRHMLHGIAPWTAPEGREGRMIAYFRPELHDAEIWFQR